MKVIRNQPASGPDANAPRELTFTSDIIIEAAAPAGQDGQVPRTPRKFNMEAYGGGPLQLSGWRFPVVVDLDGLSIRNGAKAYLEHDRTSRVGHLDGVVAVGGKLRVTGVVSSTSPTAKEVMADADNGYPWQASIGAGVQQVEFVGEGKTVTVNGREFAGPINVARRSSLAEVSFVGNGADDQTSASIAASGKGGKNAAKERKNMDTVTKEATEVVAGQEGAEVETVETQPETVTAGAPGQTVADMRVQAAAEQERIAAVRKACGDKHPDIAAQAIRDGWDGTRTELEVLRAERPKAPAAHIPDTTLSGRVLEAACMLSGKFGGVEKLYDEKTLEAADKRFGSDLGLQELLLECAWANGYTGRSFRESRAVLRAAFGRDVQAGFSTVDIDGILSNVANKFLLQGFFSVERVWRNICAVRNVRDFKTSTSYRLIGADQYQPVGRGGEIKSGTLGNETYSNKADTYAIILSVDRRDIINDDLGAITTVPRKLGRGSGLAINDVFWTIFLNNATFFAAGNNNYLAGANTALSIDGLTGAETTFNNQVDSDGKPIGIVPSIVLVPTALNAIGTQLFKAAELRDNTTGKGAYPTNNPHQGKYQVQSSRYLANAKYTGNSAAAWYLLADPADLPVIEVAFLNGQEAPTIETAVANFDVLGIQMRGYHDFGCALQDPRGGVRSKGSA